ncbi:MAG: hypothetical protein AB1344_01620 [Pseudomonadota bacterium]
MSEKVYKHGRGGSDAEHQAHQADIMALFEGHKSLKRVTENLPNGIRICTTSDDPHLATILRRHATDMKARFAKGRAIRSWDPLFAMLFEQRENIRVALMEREDGLCAELTCDDPVLLPLIHAHDATLHKFIEYGASRSGEASATPDQTPVD